MNDQVADHIAARLRSLPGKSVTAVFVDYSLQLTICARAYFLEGRFDAARKCNETLHRLLGYVANQLQGEDASVTESMIKMVVGDAISNGWILILQNAVERARGASN